MANNPLSARVRVIGGGLAGSEAAYYLARQGIPTELVDMKPKKFTPAHTEKNFGELVCSNSLKSNDVYANACGLLKEEMRLLGSLVTEAADATAVPAGAALAVDRESFSAYITEKLKNCPNLSIICAEIEKLPSPAEDVYTIVATGPLTADALAADIAEKNGRRTVFLRRLRAHRGGGQHRHVGGVYGRQVRQGHGRLHQLSSDERGIRRVCG